MGRLKLSHKQTVAWRYLEDKVTNELLYGGGAGGGKSYLGCIWHIYRRTTYPGTRGLIGRAKIAILEQSTLVTYFKVAAAMGYQSGVHFKYNSTKHTITWWNGSQTVLKDLFAYPSDPDFASLGSTEYTDAFIDEATEITLKAYEIVNSRLRWMLDVYDLEPKTLISGNPAEGWVKEKFISKNNKAVILQPHEKFVQSLVTENPDEAFRTRYIKQLDRLSTVYDKERLLYGNWNAVRAVTNPFAFQWDHYKHTGMEPFYDYKKQLIIAVDFNLTPFCATFWHIWQDASGIHCHMFDELEIENGSIPAMIDHIKIKYGRSLHNCVITGDAMGNRGDISQRDNASYYIQIMRGLAIRESQIKVSNNPTHDNSKSDVNYTLLHFPDFKIHINCYGTIRDMANVQVDAFGQIMKRDRNDPNQRADFLDTVRYMVHNMLYRWIEQHQKQLVNIL